MAYIFILQKIVAQRGRIQLFLYILCNFGQIFCTNLIQFFSVQNMGHDQLIKCSKYHLVSLLDEKQRSTFAIFGPFFIQVSLLTNSAIVQCNSAMYQNEIFTGYIYFVVAARYTRLVKMKEQHR